MLPDGTINLSGMNDPFSYFVYVEANNSAKFIGPSTSMIYINNYDTEDPVPNQPPFFEGSLVYHFVNVSKASEMENIYTIDLPSILDSNPRDEFSI